MSSDFFLSDEKSDIVALVRAVWVGDPELCLISTLVTMFL